jgi:hypothetical protein
MRSRAALVLRQRKQYCFAKPTFKDLLMLSQSSSCQIIHDKVYALLSLTNFHDKDFEIDYRMFTPQLLIHVIDRLRDFRISEGLCSIDVVGSAPQSLQGR